jgi:chitodextrinase
MVLVAGFSLFGARLLGLSGDSTAPAAPASLRAIGATAQQVDLAWNPVTDPGSGIKEYRIVREDNGRERIATTTLFHDTMDIAGGVTYVYTVIAVDGAGNSSPPSPTLRVTTPVSDAAACAIDTVPPSQPVSVRATSVTATAVTLEWDAATDAGGCGLAGYLLFRDGTDTGISAAGTVVTEDGLEPNRSYVYTIVARDNATNDSSPSAGITVATLARPVQTQNPCELSAPQSLHGTGKTHLTVSLAWNAPKDACHLDRYLIYRGGNLVGESTDTWFTVSGLVPNTFYVFTVRARNTEGEQSPASNLYGVRTAPAPIPPDTTPPSVPTGLAVTDRNPQSVHVTWGASTDTGGSGLKEYEVFLDGNSVDTTSTPGYTFSPLIDLTPYTVEVRAVDHAGNKSAKASVTFTTKPIGGLTLSAPDTVAFATDVTFSGDNADPLGTLSVTIDGTPVPCVCPIAADGTYTGVISVDYQGTVTGTSVVLVVDSFYDLAVSTVDQPAGNHPFQVT